MTRRGAAFAHTFVLGEDEGVRCRVTAECVIAKDAAGILHHKYEAEIIPWLHPEQRWWIEAGFVRTLEPEVQVPPRTVADTAQPNVDQATGVLSKRENRVDECIAALSLLQLPLDAGGRRARTALRESHYSFSFGNDIIAAAIRTRREKVSRAHDQS